MACNEVGLRLIMVRNFGEEDVLCEANWCWTSAHALLRRTKNISRWIFGPVVFGIAAAELFADGCVGVFPEAGEVVGDLLAAPVGC